jgi:hypothetical protein
VVVLASLTGGDHDAPVVAAAPPRTVASTAAAASTSSPTTITATSRPTTTAATTTTTIPATTVLVTTAETTAATATTPPPPSADGPLAIDLLASITVRNEASDAGYERDLFGYPRNFGGGCDTRLRVLEAESAGFVQVDPIDCTVVAGDWVSPYDGVATSSPVDLQIDHLVALNEAWQSGAAEWDDATRVAFANDLDDPRTLIAVTVEANQSKGNRDPSNWLPPNETYVCTYVSHWVAVKARWQLSMDQSEHGRIRNLLRGRCEGTRLDPVRPATITTAALPPPPPPPIVGFAPTPPSADVYYANCDEARAAGAAPLLEGQPGYRARLDGDKDGIACE